VGKDSLTDNGVASRRFILKLKNDIQMNNLPKMHKDCQAGNGAKPNVVRSFLSRLFFCKIMDSHEWTSNAQQGIPPTPEQLKSVAGFWDYATMYCKRCGHISELSKRCLCKYKN
jgi:hypothetical protein